MYKRGMKTGPAPHFHGIFFGGKICGKLFIAKNFDEVGSAFCWHTISTSPYLSFAKFSTSQ